MRGQVEGAQSLFSFQLLLRLCGCSVAQAWPTLCDPLDGSTVGFPVPHHLLEFAQTQVH